MTGRVVSIKPQDVGAIQHRYGTIPPDDDHRASVEHVPDLIDVFLRDVDGIRYRIRCELRQVPWGKNGDLRPDGIDQHKCRYHATHVTHGIVCPCGNRPPAVTGPISIARKWII